MDEAALLGLTALVAVEPLNNLVGVLQQTQTRAISFTVHFDQSTMIASPVTSHQLPPCHSPCQRTC